MDNSFGIPIIPHNEEERLTALYAYQILDSEPEVFFDNLALIIARSFDMPIALISLVDKERVFFKAGVGMPGTRNTPRGISLCSLAVLKPEPLIVADALKEPCLLANPLVAGAFGLRFYAGAPMVTSGGYNIGTVCVVDKKPRIFDEMDEELLARFAQTAMKAIHKRKETFRQAGK